MDLSKFHLWGRSRFAFSGGLDKPCAKYHIDGMAKKRTGKGQPHNLTKSGIIAEVPKACSDEAAAVEFMERRRWNGEPTCAHCASKSVYQMQDTNGGRSKRFLWRCRDCRKQFTVRVGTIFEDSRIPLRKWCYAFWAASTNKNGVAALEICRNLQVTYKTALFMLHRIRFAMAPGPDAPKLGGNFETVEADETYVGGKPRHKNVSKRGLGTSKTPVFAVVQRNGEVRTKVIANVTAGTLGAALRARVHPNTRLMTDDFGSYKRPGKEYFSHQSVNHSAGEYVRGDAYTNTIEGFFSILKRSLNGTYRAVSRKHLHRYLAEFEFRWNARKLNDGERLELLVKWAAGKRLMYSEPWKKQKPYQKPLQGRVDPSNPYGFPIF